MSMLFFHISRKKILHHTCSAAPVALLRRDHVHTPVTFPFQQIVFESFGWIRPPRIPPYSRRRLRRPPSVPIAILGTRARRESESPPAHAPVRVLRLRDSERTVSSLSFSRIHLHRGCALAMKRIEFDLRDARLAADGAGVERHAVARQHGDLARGVHVHDARAPFADVTVEHLLREVILQKAHHRASQRPRAVRRVEPLVHEAVLEPVGDVQGDVLLLQALEHLARA